MKPPVESIRLGKQSRDQLIKIKRNTGVDNWNIICRWAFCASIREETPPSLKKASQEDGVEMSWKVFAGDQADVLVALIAQDVPDDIDPGQYLHAHLRRGLGYLASGTDTRTVGDFVRKWTAPS